MRYLVLFSLCFISLASRSQQLPFELSEAQLEEISKHPTWHKLLHYEPNFFKPTSIKSAIHSPEFFNSLTGQTNPKAELLATLLAFYKPIDSNPDEHAQCKFRARYLWLNKKLQLDRKEIEQATCKKFNVWALNGKATSISIVFATGYLDNPASYYGHTLIKMNSDTGSTKTNLLDVSVNFGAIRSDGDNPFKFIFNSLVGLYDAGFSHINYYYHTHNYGEIEQRNIWEYQLNFDQEDTKFLIAHLWEVLGKEYTYYFFNANCASRMGEIFEIIPGVNVVPKNPIWVIPQSLIQKLSKATYKGLPLVKEIKFKPSRQFRFYDKFKTLSTEEKQIVKQVINEKLTLDSITIESLPLERKHSIIDTLIDYYQYTREPNEHAEDKFNLAYQKALKKRYELPPGENNLSPIQPISPDKEKEIGLVQVGTVNNSSQGSGYSLTLRPAYYDDLDRVSFLQYAELTMGKIKLIHFDGDTELRKLQILSLKSTKPNVTGLPRDTGSSWKLDFGIEKQDLECRSNCLITRLQADKGHTWRLNQKVFTGAYIGAGFQDNRNDNGNFFLRASAFSIFKVTPKFGVKLDYQLRNHLDGKLKNEEIYQISSRYQLSTKWDIRGSYQHHRSEEFSLHLGYYW